MVDKKRILIVDDEDNFREGFDQYLTLKGYTVLSAANLTDARKILRENEIDVVLLDVQIGKEYGPDLLDDINLIRPMPITFILTAYGELDMAVAVMKNGAFDFLSKPLDLPGLEMKLKEAEKLMRIRREQERYWTTASNNLEFVEGNNPKMKNVFKIAARAAKAVVSVLIYGETGSGSRGSVRAGGGGAARSRGGSR